MYYIYIYIYIYTHLIGIYIFVVFIRSGLHFVRTACLRARIERVAACTRDTNIYIYIYIYIRIPFGGHPLKLERYRED